ncbi:MAG: NAD(P)H-hydrate dehydratase [Treponema sp.]|nr:NAD(P)H-hydrate dehydratase [Treponema sp.]
MKTVTSRQMQKIEQTAIEELGIPSIILMENAAICTVKHCLKALENITNPKAVVVAGTGNNGGDGFAIARLLHLKGVQTCVLLTGEIQDGKKSDAFTNFQIVSKLNIPLITVNDNNNSIDINFNDYDLVIDAIFGTGLARNTEGIAYNIIEKMNRDAKYIISVDIPSGIHSDTGRIMGNAVKAKETVTFAFPKTGLYLYPGAEYAGKIHIEDIGIPHALLEKEEIKTDNDLSANILTESEAKSLLPLRKQRSNKGDYGKVIVFAGSSEMPGAAALSCSAVYAAGGGLVCAYTVPSVSDVLHKWQREIVTHNVPDLNGMYCKNSIENLSEEINKASVIIAGPGIGRSDETIEFVHELLKIVKVPIVLDADALFAISSNIDILKTLKAPCVITPHPGEMSRLTGLSVSEILDDIFGAASNFAVKYNVVTLLKDAHTVIANPNGEVIINITGNNALSKAGTGDVLTGLIAGFIAQGADVFNASILGAYYHGRAAEEAVLSKSNYGVTASDILDNIPIVMR